MAKNSHEDDDSSLNKDLMAMGISEDTKRSGGEHLKRQTEESINQDRKRHKVEKQSAASAKNSFEEENTSKEYIIQQYSSYINHQSGIIDDLKCQLESARRQLEEHLVTIERLEKEKKDLTLRLSKLAGANLTYNNPNIADLSDENRPTKLTEDFSELYDNEWTDAFESLDSKEEGEKTQIMLEILKKSYELCYDTSQDHVNAVKNGFATLSIRYELGEVVNKSDEEASSITEKVEAATEMQNSSQTTGFKGSLPTTEYRTDGNQKNDVMMEENLQLQPSEQRITMRLSHQNERTLPAIPKTRVKEGKIEECTEKPILTDVSQSAAVGAVKRKISVPAGESLKTSNKFTEEQSENKPIVDINQEATEGADEESHVIKSAATGGDQAESIVTEKQILTGDKEQRETNIPESKTLEDNNTVTTTKTQVTEENEGNNGKNCFKNSLDNVEGDEQKKNTNLRDWKKNEVRLEENLHLQPSKQEATIRLSHQNEQTLAAIPEQLVKESKIEECTEKPIHTDVNPSAAVGAVKRKLSEPAGESQEENKPIVDINQEATEGAEEESHVIKYAAAGGDQAEAMFTEKQVHTGNKEQHERNVPESKTPEDNNDVTTIKTQIIAGDEGHNGQKCSKNSLDNVESDEKKKVTNLRDWGVQCVPYKTLTAQFENLTKEQMKTVSDIRKYFESELTESFQKESADLIAKSLSEDMQKKEFVQTYIQRCLQICWSMCRHEPPVFIHFVKPGTDTLLDTNVFRPYTKTGEYVDYVVWPPLYLYEDGPMLSKGIAQGRK